MLGAAEDVPGFTVPVHRALTEPILLGGAPRAIVLSNSMPLSTRPTRVMLRSRWRGAWPLTT